MMLFYLRMISFLYTALNYAYGQIHLYLDIKQDQEVAPNSNPLTVCKYAYAQQYVIQV